MENNYIHPTAIIDKNVKMGNYNYIGPYCHITGDTIIGDYNRFESHCSIGTNAEHRDFFLKEGQLRIGNNNIFREFCTINSGTKNCTTLANNIVVLKGSYIGHDSILEDKVNLSPGVLLGGHSYIMEGSNFGLGSICHQYSVIGAYAMIGMGAIITKKVEVLPGNIYVGNPAKFLKKNLIGLERNNIDNKILEELNKKYNNIKNEI